MQIEYTHFGGPAEYVIHAIKANLTGSLCEYRPCGLLRMPNRLITLAAFTPLLHRMVQKNMPIIIGKYNGQFRNYLR